MALKMIDGDTAYQALTAKDRRFDGLFFVGVITTGIYCRPVCPVKTPRRENCLFFASAEAAEKAHFRPCLRCRPELAPGSAPVDNAHRITSLLVQRIDEGGLDRISRLDEVAAWFNLSLHQLRRIVQQELGVTPLELKQTRRLLLAKQLLTETRLSVTEIASASGFSSLRRFNAVFNQRYRMAPSHLRKEAAAGKLVNAPADASTLLLGYRPPYNWQAMLDFLRLRALENVEWVDDVSYARTVQLGRFRGWIRVTHAPQQHALQVMFSHSLTGALPVLLRRLRNLFDLDAHPQCIDDRLRQDPLLATSVGRAPGLRVPGAFDGFEMTVHAVLGQQITVKAAATLGGRFVGAFGEPFATPFPALTTLAPTPLRVLKANIDEIAGLGIVCARARAILALAAGCASGELPLDACSNPQQMMEKLKQLPGIGDWTASYIAMRALRWPDAFPASDIVVRNNLGKVSPRKAEAISSAWRPWRSYAVMHIWKNLAPAKK